MALAVERDAERPTGTCIVLVHPGGERTMIPDAGANDALELRELPAGGHLHLTGYTLLREGSRPAALRALALARERGMTVSVDPSSAAPLAPAPAFLDWVAGAAPAAPQRRRGARADRRGRPGARRPRARGGGRLRSREVVVTLGAGGALWSDGERVLRAPAAPPRSSTPRAPATRSPPGCSPRARAGPSRPSSSPPAARSPPAPSACPAPGDLGYD